MNIDAWLQASAITYTALEQMHEILQRRLNDGSPVFHFALCIGAVAGDGESMRGAGKLVMVKRNANENTSRNAAALEMKASLNEVLQCASQPLAVPFRSQPPIINS